MPITKSIVVKNRPRILVLSSFLILGLLMITPHFNWLVVIALLPMLFYLEDIKKRSFKQVAIDFFLGGIILSSFANLFLLELEPQNWTIRLNGWFGIAASLFAWTMIVGTSSLSYILIGLAEKCLPKLQTRLLVLPALFVAAELIRSYLFAIVSFGPGASFNPNYNWGSVAIPASGTDIVYISRFIGFFGITFLVVVINICVYYLIKKVYLLPILTLVTIAGLCFIGFQLGNKSNPDILKVSAIHLNENTDITNLDKDLVPPDGTDVLVLPEYSALEKSDKKNQILKQLGDGGVAITTTSSGSSPEANNKVIYLSKDGKLISQQDKTFLIPTGEFVPYFMQLMAKSIGKEEILADFRYTQQISKGTEPEYPVTTPKVNIGSLACSGISSLEEYRKLANNGAEVLVNSASLSFIKPNSHYHVYAKNMARFQAVHNNRPLIQAMRSGQSYILDNQGRILVKSLGQENQIINAYLSISKKISEDSLQ